MILAAAFLGQTVFVRATGAHTAELATDARTAGDMDQSREINPVSFTSDSARIARLETLLESLRQELKIPAYSAAIVKDQKVIWVGGTLRPHRRDLRPR
jgi:hypothetical protein